MDMDDIANLMREVRERDLERLGRHPTASPQTNSMTPETLRKELIEEQKIAKFTSRQKGHAPKYRSTSGDLMCSQDHDHAEAAKSLPSDYIRVFKTVVTNEYIPSLKGLDSLKPITLKQLLVGTVHRRNYVVLR